MNGVDLSRRGAIPTSTTLQAHRFAAPLATTIILAMCGLRLQFA